jgi:hypothetical protein
MDWRHATWARWLGWTLAFAVLFAGVMLPYAWRVPDAAVFPILAVFAASFVLCPIAAYRIGMRFPSPRWPAGPPVAVLATVVTILLLPTPSPPRQTALGMTTPKDELLFVLIWGGWLLLAVLAGIYSLLARAGVRKGGRRAAE